MSAPGAFVGSSDYQAVSGFGVHTKDEIVELQKALYAGDDVNNPGTAPGQGFPLRTESLESTLKNVTFEMDEIKLFKSIDKIPAFNTVEEFNRLLSYTEGGAKEFNLGWFEEGGLPAEENSTYERAVVQMKYLGAVGRVTHVANTIRAAHGNVIAAETQNRTMGMLQQLENSLFFGDSSLIPLQWDGLEKLVRDGAPDNVIDLRGGALTEARMNNAMEQIRSNFGMATDLYLGTGPFADLAQQVYDRQRGTFAVGQPGVLGTQIREFQGQHGRVNAHDSIFIQPGDTPGGAVGAPDKRPLTPSISVAPAAAGSGSQFQVSDAGTYIYKVVAGNSRGRSAAVTTAGVAVSAGESVTFTVADGGQGTTYYEIYRTEAGGSAGDAKLMTRVARTGATQVITDSNADIPGTSKGFVLQQNSRSFSWAQLLPMTRIPLAAIDTSIRWQQVLYGAIKMYAPARNIVFKNVGRL